MGKKKKSRKLNLKLLGFLCLVAALGVVFYFSSYAGVNRQVKIGAYTYWYGLLAVEEKALDRKFDAFLWYASINQSFDKNFGENLKKDGKLLQLAWEPAWYDGGFVSSEYTLKKISSGARDAEIRRWARELKAYDSEVYFRPMSEMNGNWSNWSGTVGTNKPADFVPAWIRIRKIFTEEKADKVKFVWAVNYASVPNSQANAISVYYPGDAYVDVIGINGYNNGRPELSFEQIFTKPYTEAIKLSKGRKPIIIAETGSYNSLSKPKWIEEMRLALKNKFPKITQVYWFDANKEEQWSLSSPVESVPAFRNLMDSLRTSIISDTPKMPQPKKAPAPFIPVR